jgi:hypothetical protein
MTEALLSIHTHIQTTTPLRPENATQLITREALESVLYNLMDSLKKHETLNDETFAELLDQLTRHQVPPLLLNELAQDLHEFDFISAQTTLTKIIGRISTIKT